MRFLFVLQMIFGVLLILSCMLAVARPHALMDVVLTQPELHDQRKFNETLALLKKGAGSDSTVLLLGGAAVFVTGAVSLVAIRRPPA
jgi:hypothetical protein